MKKKITALFIGTLFYTVTSTTLCFAAEAATGGPGVGSGGGNLPADRVHIPSEKPATLPAEGVALTQGSTVVTTGISATAVAVSIAAVAAVAAVASGSSGGSSSATAHGHGH